MHTPQVYDHKMAASLWLPVLHMEKIPVIESNSPSEGKVYDFKLQTNTNLPLVVASPDFQTQLCLDQGKSSDTHSYSLLHTMVRAYNVCCLNPNPHLQQFLEAAYVFCDGLLRKAENTIKSGVSLRSNEVNSHDWVFFYTWFKALETPVTIINNEHQMVCFKGKLYQVNWDKEWVEVEGIHDGNNGNRLYSDRFHINRITCGDFYILKRGVVKDQKGFEWFNAFRDLFRYGRFKITISCL
jgi:hypothetical protein